MTNPLAALEAELEALHAEWVGAAPSFGVDGVESTLDHVSGDIAAMSDAGLVRTLEAGSRLRRRVDVALARLAAEIDRRSDPAFGIDGLAQQQGHRNTTQLVADATGCPVREAAKLVRVGGAIRERESFTGEPSPAPRPHIAAALMEVAIGIDAANAICLMLDRVGPRTSFARANAYEAELAGFAAGAPFSMLQRALTHAEARLDPDGVEPRDELLHQQRSLTIHEEPSGMVRLTARLDPVTAAPIKAAVEAIVTDTLRRREGGRAGAISASVLADPGHATSAHELVVGDARSIPQLQADALADLARHASGCGEMPAVAITTVVVRMHLDGLRADLESAGVETSDGATRPREAAPTPDPSPPHRTPRPEIDVEAAVEVDAAIVRAAVAELDGFDRPISAATARRLAADAELIPVVLGNDSEPLDLGRRRRLFSRAQRIALAERDGGCASCGRNISYVHAHHIRWWERDLGTTDLSNGVLLCSHCHHVIHRGGWQIIANAREVWFVPPPHLDPERRPRLGGRARFRLRAA